MHSQFLIVTIIWFVLFGLVINKLWRERSVLSGVALTHVVILTSAHAFQGIAYALPWYIPEYDPEVIFLGYSQAAIAFAALTFGYLVAIPLVASIKSAKKPYRRPDLLRKQPRDSTFLFHNAPILYLAIGIVSQFLLRPVLIDIPTIGAFAHALSRLYTIGLALILFRQLKKYPINYVRISLVGLGGMALIATSVALDGFIGFVLPPVTLFTLHFMMRLRMRRLILPIAIVTLYAGLSLIVTYFIQRGEIRSVVWSDADYDDRFIATQNALISSFVLFDINNRDHLWIFDIRMSLNRLIGLSVDRLDQKTVEFAYGQTLLDAASSVIPRVLWTDKPTLIGGNYLVRYYTGLYFNSRTAVALGQVLELYVNFGTVGVIGGFITLSVMLYVVDRRVARAISKNDLMSAAVWLSPAFALWLVEDNYVTAVGSGVSTLLTVVIVNMALSILFSDRLTGSGTRSRPSHSAVVSSTADHL